MPLIKNQRMTRSTAPFGLQRYLAAGACITLSLVLAGCSPAGTEAKPSDDAGTTPAFEALPARFGSLPLAEELSGVVRARNQVAIRPELTATVVEVLVRNGDSVVTGQPLVRLDDATAREQLRQAEASSRLAEAAAAEARALYAEIEARVRRTRALAEDDLVSDLELETREAQLLAAEAQAAQAEARVAQERSAVEERRTAVLKTVVRAPVPGRIGQRDVEVGMVVDSGSTLLLLGDFDDLLVEVPLTQSMLHRVSEGTPVEIDHRDRDGDAILAEVSRISPFLEAASFSTTAEIDVPGHGDGLRPGMFVTVQVLYGTSRQATLVPASAIWEDPRTGEPKVFVVAADGLSEPASTDDEIPEQPRTVSLRTVEVLAEGHGQTGLRGVEPGEWVVTLGQHLLDRAIQTGRGVETAARVRPTSWERVIGLQALQREDLLEGHLAKQRKIARTLGAELPESIEELDELVAEHQAAAPRSAEGG
jgi:RND family efflux transporter MFP subunit